MTVNMPQKTIHRTRVQPAYRRPAERKKPTPATGVNSVPLGPRRTHVADRRTQVRANRISPRLPNTAMLCQMEIDSIGERLTRTSLRDNAIDPVQQPNKMPDQTTVETLQAAEQHAFNGAEDFAVDIEMTGCDDPTTPKRAERSIGNTRQRRASEPMFRTIIDEYLVGGATPSRRIAMRDHSGSPAACESDVLDGEPDCRCHKCFLRTTLAGRRTSINSYKVRRIRDHRRPHVVIRNPRAINGSDPVPTALMESPRGIQEEEDR
ncbi:hypothetical protein CC86DRAFT_460701 [Ophiobolus disseminans]|uniref:Uncharacterized protein n=1 Tax=Ophiobolus disseminans TaxID=1469910 RepID=A0A6A6ZDP3_9PLEO|nr:hypothetical protein CC86DRAFT_460701 [Ophiobolus disseminans]